MINKVCLFGDSVGKGVVFDNEKGKYVSLKESFSEIIQKKTGVDIDNFCRFGCTLTKGEEIVHRKSELLNGYDYVLLQYGANDCNFDWSKVAADPDGEHICNTPIDIFKETYKRLIKFVKDCGAKPILVSLTPVDSEKFYNWVSKNNNPEAIMHFLKEASRIERWNEFYNNVVWNIASQCGVPVLDVRSPILFERDFDDLFCKDGMHPNSKGHRVIAESLYGVTGEIFG